MAVATTIDLKLNALETHTGDLGNTRKEHVKTLLYTLATGTGAAQADEVWSDTRSAAASADTIDLLGTLTDATGATISFVDVVMIAIFNKSSTTGEDLTVGAGSNPFVAWSGAGTHTRIIQPGGFEIWYAGTVDDAAPVAGTGDIITIDPGAATISYDIVVLGRSA